MSPDGLPLDIHTLRSAYARGALGVKQVIEAVVARRDATPGSAVWIYRATPEELQRQVAALAGKGPADLPLYGIPFAIKDNIDVAGLPTTAACPAFTYTADATAPAVQRLLDAGAILVGKTNLDQFATGLNGTRSPYGACPNAFDPAYIAGGSSSGSAVAVAQGVVSFALGTDTAGSGRVPAAFNNIVGLKPTRGLVSGRGVVPACRSLDTLSVFAGTAGDALAVLRQMAGFDPADEFSRPDAARADLGWRPRPERFRFGVPRADQREFYGDEAARGLYADAIERLSALGGTPVEIDLAPFLEAALLLYGGPWVAERYHAIRELIAAQPDALHPTVRTVIEAAREYSAVDTFDAIYRLEALKRIAAPTWRAVDLLLLPTAPTLYTLAELRADPVRLNSRLGHYTNFVNLMDLSAVAVPAGFLPSGLPWGVSLIAPAWRESSLCALGDAMQRAAVTYAGLASPLPAPPAPEPAADVIRVCVSGAHMEGLPLNHQLTERGGRLVRRCRTAPVYRLFAFERMNPPRPGMVRMADGVSLAVEVWELPVAAFGGFVADIPAPLGIGTVELEDGSHVHGFLCEAYAVAQARDISALGGWRAYLAGLSAEA